MSEQMFHELVDMPDAAVPVKIFSRQTDNTSSGCQFNWHEQMELFCIAKGGLLLQCGKQSHWLYAGDVGVVNCNEPHKSLRFLDGTSHYVVQIDLAGLLPAAGQNVGGEAIFSLIHNIQSRIPRREDIRRLFENLIAEYYDKKPGYALMVTGYAHLIVALLLRDFCRNGNDGARQQPNSGFKYVGDILSYVERNYTHEIHLQDIADQLCITVPYMCRIFKAKTGNSIVQYCNQLRCYRARLALESGCSVTDAAFLYGFSDTNYFSRVFKKTFGVAPSRISAAK